MSIKTLAAAAMLIALGSPALAQTASMHSTAGQTSTTGSEHDRASRMESANERHEPTTRQLNRSSANYSRMRSRSRTEYRNDRRAYMASVMRKHRQSVSRYHRRYARQEMAYADAMAAWRRQVSACHQGNRRACSARSPRVADFY